MPRNQIKVSGKEQLFNPNEIIVSKTDLKGYITYANEVFCNVAGYKEEELLGQPHNIIRHPDMPACVFKLLWDTIESEEEIFAYVVNRCKNGDHYWVFAHVTPSFDRNGFIRGYHSNRRVPYKDALKKIKVLYNVLLEEEKKFSKHAEGIRSSSNLLYSILENAGMTYSEYVFSLSSKTRLSSIK